MSPEKTRRRRCVCCGEEHLPSESEVAAGLSEIADAIREQTAEIASRLWAIEEALQEKADS